MRAHALPFGIAAWLSTSGALASALCNQYCEPRDPAMARGDRIAATATVWSRTIALHISDADDMGWASIDNGDPTDEVWLDRSFDGGRTWTPDGSKLGDTTIPAGRGGWRTLMYNVDDPSNFRIGALRACGKAGNRTEIACTPWFRSTVNASTPTDAAATALMQFYDTSTGLWNTTGWWNSANALTASIDYSQLTGNTTYQYAIATTFDANSGGNFINNYLDDTGWWGLAWLRAYDLTGDPRYLSMAQTDADYMDSYRDGQCGGGVWWSTAKTYKNAIANELFIALSAGLHNRLPGDSIYLARAQADWSWFQSSGMTNGQNLINDGIDLATCQNNGKTTWTYNQGVILGALVELNIATGDGTFLSRAKQLADASTASAALNPNGILREPCESGNCGGDGPSFKGIYMRHFGCIESRNLRQALCKLSPAPGQYDDGKRPLVTRSIWPSLGRPLRQRRRRPPTLRARRLRIHALNHHA